MLEVLISVLISTGSVSPKQAQNMTKEQAAQVAQDNQVDESLYIWILEEGR